MNEPPIPIPAMLAPIARYYTDKLERFGATAAGVDWNSAESQQLRFEQLLRLIPDLDDGSVNDYGCGYGALADYLHTAGRRWSYHGYDISDSMIACARALHPDMPRCSFTSDPASLVAADFTFASGVFNVTLGSDAVLWRDYVGEALATLNRLSVRAFAFNMLSTYSDPDRRRPDLFYADPFHFFDLCKRHFSRCVALLHDYPLYEFTLVVRK
jgi:SAM-dependent methyltransferase